MLIWSVQTAPVWRGAFGGRGGDRGQATTALEPRSLLPTPTLETIATWAGRGNETAREEWREAGTDRPAEAFKDAGLLSSQLASWRETELGGTENPGARGRGEKRRQASARRGCVEERETRGGRERAP